MSRQVSASLKNKSGASAPPPNRIDDSLETTERESGGLVLSPNNEVESELESDSSATNGENLDWVTNIMGMNAPKWACKMIEMGKKPAPLTTLEVAEENGEVLVKL